MGYSVSQPGAVGPATVRLTTTADALAGMPAKPVSGKCTSLSAPMGVMRPFGPNTPSA